MAGTRAARPAALAAAGLVAVTAIWGSTFVLIKGTVDELAVTDFLASRFVLAAAVMVALLGRHVRALGRRQVLVGLALGGVYGVAQILQTEGLATTPAAVSGFVTGTYVVITPLLAAVLLRQRIPPATWVAVLLATGGLALLALRGLSVGAGELLTLASAALYAAHIVGLGRWSRAHEALGLATVQMVAVAAVCLLAALPAGVRLPSGAGQWWAVGYTAVMAGAVALVVQTWAQAHLTATRAAIIMTLEPVFAAAFAVALGGERLTWRTLAGGLLVLVAMYLAELGPRGAATGGGEPGGAVVAPTSHGVVSEA